MILIEKTSTAGLEQAIRGMRNPMNSWDKSDSFDTGIDSSGSHIFRVGENDHGLMMKLAKGGSVHGKYRRMIIVYVDVTAPLYWWKEFDTYKVGTVANSCSTMHKIHAKEFVIDDFSHEHLIYEKSRNVLYATIITLNQFREAYLAYNQDDETKKAYWWQMIQLLPSSYNQKRTIMLNYEVLAGIYEYRRNHKLDEWGEFCKWIGELPYSELITCNSKEDNK